MTSYSVSTSNLGEQMTKKFGKREICLAQLFAVVTFAIGIVGGVLIGIYVYHGCEDNNCKQQSPETTLPTTDSETTTNENQNNICPRSDARIPWDGDEPEIFSPLTETEMTEVNRFMKSNGYIASENPIIGDPESLKLDYILAMFLSPPNKERVLMYKNGTGPYPGRYATVHVVRGSRSPPDQMQYKVGPLNQDSLNVTQLYADREMSFNSRPYESIEIALYLSLLQPEFHILETLLQESFDGAFLSDSVPDFSIFPFPGPPGLRSNDRETTVAAVFYPIDELFLLNVLPFSATIHCPGNDFGEWYVYDYYYVNQGPFTNASALLDAYNSGTIRKFALPTGFRQTVLDRHLPDRDPNAPFRDRAHIPPPRTYEPEGPRYKIKGHHVDWMGWSFDVTSGQLRGPGLFYITYKGESVAYELSLNDISLIYGSGTAGHIDTIYTDSTFGIGISMGMVKNVDCPVHSTLLETSFWDGYSSTFLSFKTICVFESDGENSVYRHHGNVFEAGLRNTYLVVRYATAIGNYDYILEWHFYLDGKIYTVASASGYIQGAFWDEGNPFMGSDKSRDAFGYRVSDFTSGMIHDHMFGYKVDLDILGIKNTMEVVHWRSGSVLDALRSQNQSIKDFPPFYKHNTTRYVEYEYVEKEHGYSLDLNRPEFWLVVNEDKQNEWGVNRGYQIHPTSTAVQTLSNSHPAMQALSFTKYQCAVTRRKEDEQYLTSSTDINRLDEPIGDLDKMLDNEDIRNQDIVNWVSVGFIHIPTAEDVPMTNRVEAGFLLKPFNFFNRTDVFDMPGYFYARDESQIERPSEFTPCLEPPSNDTLN